MNPFEQEPVPDLEFMTQVARYWKSKEQNSIAGDSRFGRFIVEDCIGQGGFGIVYRAFDPLLGRQVAIKVPNLSSLLNENRIRRFLAEANCLGLISHPNIVRVYEASENDGLCYLVMQYCNSGNLAKWLSDTASSATEAQLLALMQGIASGLAAAHASNVIHRDLKPTNVLLDSVPADALDPEIGIAITPVVSDFGLAKMFSPEETMSSESWTASGTRLGTLAYMAPEQRLGRVDEIDASTDVYALGLIFLDLLKKQFAIDFSNSYDSGIWPAELLERLSIHIDPAMLAVLHKSLATSRHDRFQNAGELLRELKKIESLVPRVSSAPLDAGAFKNSTRQSVRLLFAIVPVLVFLSFMMWIGVSVLRQHVNSKSHERWPMNNQRGYALEIHSLFQNRNLESAAKNEERLERIRSLIGASPSVPFEFQLLASSNPRESLLLNHSGHVHCLAFSEDGKHLACTGKERDVLLWDVEKNLLEERYSGLGNLCQSVSFSKEMRLIVATAIPDYARSPEACDVVVWDSETTTVLANLRNSIGAFEIVSIECKPATRELWFFGRDLANLPSRWICSLDQEYRVSKSRLPDYFEPWSLSNFDSSWVGWDRRPWKPNRSFSRFRFHYRNGDGAKGMELVCQDMQSGKVSTLHREAQSLDFIDADNSGCVLFAESSFLGDQTRPMSERLVDTNFVLWDPSSNKTEEVFQLKNQKTIDSLTFSREHNRLAYTLDDDGYLRVRVLQNRSEYKEFIGHSPKESWSVDFARDSKRLISSGDDGTVLVSPIEEKTSSTRFQPLRWAAHPESLITQAVVNPQSDLELATAGFDGFVKLWSIEAAPKLLLEWQHPDKVRCVTYSRNGAFIATGCDDHCIRIWDRQSGALCSTLKAHTGKIRCLSFTGEGTLISGGNDSSIRSWDIASGEMIRDHQLLGNPCCVAVTYDDASVVFGVENGTIGVLQKGNPGPELITRTSNSPIRAIAVSPDSLTMAVGAEDGSISLYNIASQIELARLEPETSAVMSLGFSSDNKKLAAAHYSGKIRVWHSGNNTQAILSSQAP